MTYSSFSGRVLSFALCSLLSVSCVSSFSSASRLVNKSHADDNKSLDTDDLRFGVSDWSPARRDVNASQYFMMAEFAALENKANIAEKYYEDAYNLDPNAYLGAKWIASKALRRPEEALLDAKKMTLLYPRNFEIQMLYGKILAMRGLSDESMAVFQKASKLQPQRVEAYLGLMNVYKIQNNLKLAIKQALKITDIEPSFAEIWAELAKLYISEKENKKALNASKRAYDIDSNNPENILIHAFCLELNGSSEKAIALYESLLRLNPTNEDIIQRMVSLYKEFGALEDALSLLQDAEDRSGKISAGLRLQMVYIHWELEEFQKAALLLDDLVKRFPESDRLMYMSGLGHEKIGRLTAAIQTYLAIKPGSTFYLHANFRSIQLYLQLDDVDNAVELAEKIIASDEGQQKKDFYLVLAQIYADRQAFDDAIATLVKAYKQYPSELVFLFTQAVYYEKKGEYSACVDVLKQVISNDASHAVALNFLGYLYAERGENLDQAEELIKRALEIRPGDGFFLDSLGWVYFQKKDYPLALETLLKANELTPNEGVILEHIAETYQALGDRKKALEFMEAATKSRLEKRDKSRIIEKYEEMKKS